MNRDVDASRSCIGRFVLLFWGISGDFGSVGLGVGSLSICSGGMPAMRSCRGDAGVTACAPVRHTDVRSCDRRGELPFSNVLSEEVVAGVLEAISTCWLVRREGSIPDSNCVRLLTSVGFISEAERDAFDEFWQLRNNVVHGRSATPPTDEQTARVLDLLWRLVRALG
jgi:hypothetical protein